MTKTRVSDPPTQKIGASLKLIGGIIFFFIFCFIVSVQVRSCSKDSSSDQVTEKKIQKITKEKYQETFTLNEYEWAIYAVKENWQQVIFDTPNKDIYIKIRYRGKKDWEKEKLMEKGSYEFPFDTSRSITHFGFRTKSQTLENFKVYQYNI